VSVALFFGGMVLIGLIVQLLPDHVNPHHGTQGDAPSDGCPGGSVVPQSVSDEHKGGINKTELKKSGTLVVLALAIHNFPEGFATFGTALGDARLGLIIAIAIALHNIPEGIAVAIPVLYATGDKWRAFGLSLASGLAEPVGAVVAYLFLMPILTEEVVGGTLAFVAGIMVYISLDEILPAAHKSGHGHLVILGVGLGMLVMAVSLMLL
jgi:ZIP family zinc transporter